MKRIERSRILFLDTGVILKFLQFDSMDYPVISRVLDLVYEREIQMIVSTLTFHEVQTRAFLKNELLARQFKEFFTRSSYLQMREIDTDVAMVSASLRSKHGLSLTDSLQLGCATVSGADTLFTENASWQSFFDANVVTIDDLR